ncbi:tRNA uridine-5-carboxymethylaminomethyl(34) synthesis GTPase MnmE [Entomospira culicis]|uniref:tRNA modification GTPase MnmE n=1 Tax=Entomospira culicis TaxID=2719989 RepID=A0A968KTN1_9SPIO|nr:tRNA uridine-5-carboxymethylaminomethyl(34) synthesis GTPase MnmE [Entomospira culicis]NIZ18413.1 tRNA uridine-5-carboxymethylaminomethyl(34) synthesis GTPase MnmE [Entomospira culicis]NIZ68629.1 tRNA uridine-5-carboxymethylaminomethyl(34) synthesis GTPase MnmE [Entomospira culicis]WDI37229.1 tRNA uridine-5-carboxymethylaminomethyl(34) synthesis GTPase MnmE [Entomospira culicis]WDI38857.1 tRNA uridine-5-carboxymethylaminomethyl(34) synthesis GTPase MnmE [Entomospira culicis]
MEALYTNEPIVALATPWGRSALAVIRLSGEGTLALLASSFTGKLDQSHRMVFGKLVDRQSNQTLDEVMIAPFTHGAGYTGEEACEIYCHGNPHLIETILHYLVSCGFRLALPGEFSYRAVKHGKMDLTQAEAVHELIMAQTALAAQSALHRLSGGLGKEFGAIYQAIIDRLGAVEAYLDYPEEELEPFVWLPLDSLREQLFRYLKEEPIGQILQEGALVVLAGEPNVGKSSLFNWLVGSERAIVSPEAGTTRDYIEVTLDVHGYPIRLVDTAGLRESAQAIEQMGIQKSYELLAQADVILYLTTPAQPADDDFMLMYRDKLIWLENKRDALARDAQVGMEERLAISVLKGLGLEEMLAKLVAHIDPDGVAKRREHALLGSLRQREIVQQALNTLVECEALAKEDALDLVAFTLRKASGYFAQLIGTDMQQDAMDAMFRQFCLGK